MATNEERINAAIVQLEGDSELLHDFMHNPNPETVITESGPIPTVSKLIVDLSAQVVAVTTEAVTAASSAASSAAESASKANLADGRAAAAEASAANAEQASENAAAEVSSAVTAANQAAASAQTSSTAAQSAASSAGTAQTAATNAATSAGEAVAAAQGGVRSFKTRTGNVSPASGDYTAAQITSGETTAEARLDSLDDADADIRSRAINVALDFAEIKADFEQGGVMKMRNGGYYATSSMKFDYTGVVGFIGHPSPRQSVTGEVRGGSILSVQHSGWAMESVGPAPFAQATGGLDEFGCFTLVGPNVTAAHGEVGDGKGLRIANRAQTYIHDIELTNLEQGFHFDGLLSSHIARVSANGCAVPSVINTTDLTSGPNAMLIDQMRFGNNPNGGAHIEVGAAMQFNTLTAEGNGHPGLGIGAVNFYASHEPFAGTLTINQFYGELNAGLADLYIENKTSAPLTVIIMGGIFARVSATQYVESHIVVNSTGGGTVDVHLYNPEFIEGFGYVPSVSRPLWREINDKCRVHCHNPTMKIGAGTTIPLSHTSVRMESMALEANGGLYTAGGFTAARAAGVAAGHWIITASRPIAREVYGYQVQATVSAHSGLADAECSRVKVRRLTESTFSIRTFSDAGALVDASVDILLTGLY